MNETQQRVATKLLDEARSMFSDLVKGWPLRELCRKPSDWLIDYGRLLADVQRGFVRDPDENITTKPQATGSAEPWDISVANLKTLNARDDVRYADLLSDGRYKVIDDTGAQITASYEQVCDWLFRSGAGDSSLDEELTRPTFENVKPVPIIYEHHVQVVAIHNAAALADTFTADGWELVTASFNGRGDIGLVFRKPRS